MVAVGAKKQVDAQPPPQQRAVGVLVDQVAVGLLRVGVVVGRQAAPLEGRRHHIPNARGAVVAEEIVFIVSVLGPQVDYQHLEQRVQLAFAQPKALLVNRTAEIRILQPEAAERLCGDKIIEPASGKTQIEMRLAEVESAVVEHHVEALRAVAYPQRRMAERLIELVARTAGQNARKGRVGQPAWHTLRTLPLHRKTAQQQ